MRTTRSAPVRAFATGLVVLGAVLCGACADRHDTRGLVLKVDRGAGVVTVSHDEIPGFMDAMVMPLTAARAADLDEVRPGDRIAFRLNVRRDRTRIDRIRLLSAGASGDGVLTTAGAAASVAIGTPVPGFALTNHRGQAVSLDALRGRVVAVGFIYTRCPRAQAPDQGCTILFRIA